MNHRFRFSMLLMMLFSLPACGPRETWNYLVLGGATQEYATKFPEVYAAFIEKDQRVSVVMNYYTGYSPGWILDQMDASQNLRDLIVNADVITFDWDPGSTDAAEYSFLQGTCGGSDNQDCLRADYQEAREVWITLLDKLIALRNSDTSGMRQLIMGSWPYPVHYPDVNREQMNVILEYFQAMSVFLMEEAEKRDIEYVKLFDGEYLHEKRPPEDWINGLALTEEGDKIVLDALKRIEFEKPAK